MSSTDLEKVEGIEINQKKFPDDFNVKITIVESM